MVNGLRTLSLSTLLACLSPAASAADAESFESLRVPAQCINLFLSLDSILEARERGVTKNQLAKTVDAKDAVPQEAIDAAFDEPRPRRQEVIFYWGMECKARAYDIPVAPFSEIRPLLSKCAFDGTHSQCLREAENAMLKRPRDFARPPPPAPPRAPGRRQPTP